MSLPRFIQIHTLHTYPAALLNRDDAGMAKRLPLGNAVRTRISSQCLKRHWRVTDDKFSLSKLDVPMAIRSRGTLELIGQRIQENGISAAQAQSAAEALRDAGLLDKSGKNITGEDALKTGQAVLMGKAEIDYITKLCVDTIPLAIDLKNNIAQCDGSPEQIYALLSGSCFLPVALHKKIEKDGISKYADDLSKLFKEVQKLSESDVIKSQIKFHLISEKENIEALKHGSGLESALFGRMVTSDILASREASVSVAHAFTVHQAQVENDYFTVVDDLMQESGELGSAGIFDTELASGLYYGYVVVDVSQLVENLEGIAAKDCFTDGTPAERRELAGRVAQHLIHLIATVSPGAKRGSTAPFDWAKFMLVEAGDWQPRSLAGAFYDALPLEDKTCADTIRQRAVTRMTQEISAMDEAYGAPLARRFLALDTLDVPGAERVNLTKLGEWANEIVRQGAC
ncbi:MAG: type I-E CRISPR-associated protein Cas7/Cse4/CasC [Betaproteobacteria bacterium]|jgi:CRISPR system Cascade subunit CasC|nr:type I-E CRISPR-associated protein Cas7/Cse4/CasC [Betaproteobacteria bacterium]